MLVFPNAKINLGLYITGKRADGFHNLETIFYPVQWCDILEFNLSDNNRSELDLTLSGIPVQGNTADNLLVKVYRLLQDKRTLPPLKAQLHKILPMGAGLGGGSADAAFFLKALNEQFFLNLNDDELLELALKCGSDCPFFIRNKPVHASGRGEIFKPVHLDLSSYFILIIYPGIHSETREAFKNIRPSPMDFDLAAYIETADVKDWKNILFNQFEENIFALYPQIGEIKAQLYEAGAVYASLSGSGSALFGIFEKKPMLQPDVSFASYLQVPVS